MSLIARDLFQHQETADALLLSTNGNPTGSEWIPREFVKAVTHLHPCKPYGVYVRSAQFLIEEWKLRKLGWLVSEDEGQGRLAL